MLRRRTALSFSAAALLAVTPLLASCSASHAGAAAMVGGEQITVSALQTQVNEVRAAQAKSPQAAQLIDQSSQLPRATLSSMVFDRVLHRAALDAGVTASRQEVQGMRSTLERQAGGAVGLETQMLTTYGVAPGEIEEFCRTQVEAQKLAKNLGADLNTEQGKVAVTRLLTQASNELGVQVSPRYGTWDAQKLSLGNSRDPWLANVTQAE